MKGSALEAIEKVNKPFSLHWHPGNPGYWEATIGEEEIRASGTSPDVAIATVLERFRQQSQEES